MKSILTESAGELLALVGSAVGSLLLTLAGTVTELAAIRNASTGQVTLGAWEAAVGVLLLLAGLYLLGYREFLPRLAGFRQSG